MSNDFRILVAVDFSGMDRVLVEVERQARAHDALITLLHVAQPDPEFVGYLKVVVKQPRCKLTSKGFPRQKP
jgi:hypothetical protein